MGDSSNLASEGKIRRWLAIVALTLFVLVALLPSTGWMVRAQVGHALGALTLRPARFDSPPEETPQVLERIRAIAVRYPGDFPLQLAATQRLGMAAATSANVAGSNHWREDVYDTLEERFAGLAALHANVLRFSTNNWVHVRRPETEIVESYGAPAHLPPFPQLNRPEAIRRFLARATAGERLEPDNAYFPMLASVAYFAAYRDSEGVSAIRRAASKGTWDEHFEDHLRGNWRLDEALGRKGALLCAYESASLVFPQYSQMRAATRLAIYRAMLAEQSGKTETGFRIRQAVMLVGSLMRVQGKSIITNNVGLGITGIAMLRPAGVPRLASRPNEGYQERANRLIDAYCAHLRRIGHGEETTWLRAEVGAGRTMCAIQPLEAYGVVVWIPYEITATYWAAAQTLLVSIGWWAALGLLAAVLAATPWGRSGRALPAPLKRGIALGVCGLLTAGWLVNGLNTIFLSEATSYIAPPLMVGALIFGGRWFFRNFRNKAIWRGVSLGLFGAALSSLLLPPTAAVLWEQGIGGIGLVGSTEGFCGTPESPYRACVLLAALVLPVVASVSLSLAAAVLRVPLGIGLVRGFRGATTPMICLLLLAYGGIVLATPPQEAQLDYRLTRAAEHEGRFYAELTGKQWPGPTR